MQKYPRLINAEVETTEPSSSTKVYVLKCKETILAAKTLPDISNAYLTLNPSHLKKQLVLLADFDVGSLKSV
jgi:hypothetical protein